VNPSTGAGGPETSIVLVDGEHYPPVTARAIAGLRAAGEQPVLALLVGGHEKLGQVELDLGVPVEIAPDAEAALAAAIPRTGAGRVFDLSDEPVLGNERRCRLASVALWRGASYAGADFRFTPPPRPPVGGVPSVSVIGMGKRTGKTAVAGQAARAWASAGFRPVIVAMGRGGPPDPEVIMAGESLDPARLLAWAEGGRHAASDYIEDALTAGVPTVGAWRAGGGLAGATYFSNYDRAVEQAKGLDPGLLVLEGSGAAIPPAGADAGILIVDADIDPSILSGYFGLFRLLLADLVVLTMCEESTALRQLSVVEDCVRNRPLPSPSVVRTIFRPHPLGDLSGKRTWFATTAGRQATTVLKRHLEEAHGARVTGVSHALADRQQLRRDLEEAQGAEVLAVELKAAAVDVVTKFGIERGIEVVYVDNRALAVAADGSPLPGGEGDVNEQLLAVAAQARERFASGAGTHEA
jgi:cyclic 2,3-diphosphoglycerate synthetase